MTRDAMPLRGAGQHRCFDRDYALGRAAAVREFERQVLGCDYGATSWTTRDEANSVARWLELRHGMRLLDVGAGAGWPGLYLALISGCHVVLTDIPVVGLNIALERARDDGIGDRCTVVAADAAALPFPSDSFHAITHSDVLCCMPAKLSLLHECRRVARKGARMMFSVIAPAAGLSDDERRIANETGPEFVDVDQDYCTLLGQAGWRVVQRIDATELFARSLRKSLEVMHANAGALVEVLGADDYRDRVARREATLFGLDRRVLKRELFAVANDR